ncbi:MAG: hypothetical protein IPN73_05820 [Saprospiraceae bacterium]|nr:hypothetical protein [Saprospiraceae bacterium]
MPKQQTEYLVDLIHSLSKSEKRNFRLFAGRLGNADEKLFLQLFDFIDDNRDYNESLLLQKITGIKKSQLPNLKAHLYRQLLGSLRWLGRNTYEDIAAREWIDHARILLTKGMQKAALESIEKAKKSALAIHNQPLLYHALDFERFIENQFVTGSNPVIADRLKKQGDDLVRNLVTGNEYSNLSMALYTLYLKHGYVKDQKDFDYIHAFFQSNLPQKSTKNLDFYEKVYLFQCQVWYHHMIQDFAGYYKFSQKWVDCFESDPKMILTDTTMYLKGLHNTLNALYMAGKRDKFKSYFQKYKSFGDHPPVKLGENDRSNYLMYYHLHLLNEIFLTGQFDSGKNNCKPLEELLKKNEMQWDESRIIVLHYKLACVYFGANDYSHALTYLNLIINAPSSKIRQDIQCFARFLSLIVHYELGNEVLMSYQIRSVFRFLSNMEDLQGVQREILSFLRKTPNIFPTDVKKEFKSLRAKLLPYSEHPYEKRPFLYLDIIAWLDAKINGTTVQEEVLKKIK